MKKRFYAFLLALCMVLTMLPVSAFTAEVDQGGLDDGTGIVPECSSPDSPDGCHRGTVSDYEYSDCVSPGVGQYLCEYCGEAVTVDAPPQGHDWSGCNGLCAREGCGTSCMHMTDDGSCWTECEDGTSACSICGMICIHETLDDGERNGCTICYFCTLCCHMETEESHDWSNRDGICARTGCGAICDHKEYERDTGLCATCGMPHDHTGRWEMYPDG